MNMFISFFRVSLLAAIISMAQADNGGNVIPSDWTPSKDRTFEGTALYGYMNGGSDEYLQYGFQCLRVLTLEADGHEYEVEIFRMDTPENAYGIYSQHVFKPLREDSLPQADHDALSNYQLQAVKGAFYISIVFQEGQAAAASADILLKSLCDCISPDSAW